MRGALAFALAVLAAGPAHAAAGGPMDLLLQGVNLLILLGVIVYFARKPIQNFFADRRSRIKEDLELDHSAPAEDSEPVPAPEPDARDDLRRIKGVGPRYEEALNALGIHHFAQIATWGPDEMIWISFYLSGSDRLKRKAWVPQARILAVGSKVKVPARIVPGT